MIARVMAHRAAVRTVAAMTTAVSVCLCCLGPTLLLVLGLSGTWVYGALEPWRPYLTVAEALGFLVYFGIRERRGACEEGSLCATAQGQAIQASTFWVVTAITLTFLVLLALGYWDQALPVA